MLGGGQLGRMSLLAGRALGYRFHVFDPSPGCAAAPVAETATVAAFDDADALRAFAEGVDVVTLEFENIPAESLRLLESLGVPVAPNPAAVATCQHRGQEKMFLRERGFPHVRFAHAATAAELGAALDAVGYPCVVKTAAFGYDGKGQHRLDTAPRDLAQLWCELGAAPLVVEAWCPFEAECSMLVARGWDGSLATFPLAENTHRHHILHQSILPARLPERLEAEARELAQTIAAAFDFVGILAVELFVTPKGLLVNEFAPRPHNSGHVTIEACVTSQFEQHIRAVCGLPLGSTALRSPAVMTNLLGDVWPEKGGPDWTPLLRHPNLKLHLYDKGEPRSGRKMGHYTLIGEHPDKVLAEADEAFAELAAQP